MAEFLIFNLRKYYIQVILKLHTLTSVVGRFTCFKFNLYLFYMYVVYTQRMYKFLYGLSMLINICTYLQQYKLRYIFKDVLMYLHINIQDKEKNLTNLMTLFNS